MDWFHEQASNVSYVSRCVRKGLWLLNLRCHGLQALLTFAKAKVASLKSESIASLELRAAFVGTRALRMVLLETKLIAFEVHAQTNSRTVR